MEVVGVVARVFNPMDGEEGELDEEGEDEEEGSISTKMNVGKD